MRAHPQNIHRSLELPRVLERASMTIAFLVLASAARVVVAEAATVLVPEDQPTIQAGIDAAGTGDSVLVAPGSYSGAGNEDIDFAGKNVVLLASDGTASTTIQGPDADPYFDPAPRAFLFHGGETNAAVVEGFTIRDFHILGPAVTPAGGGAMVIAGGAAPTIRNCVFSENSVIDGAGGAVYAEGGTFEDCLFSENRAEAASTDAEGGAVYCRNVTMTRCTVRGNVAAESSFGEGSGGGLLVRRNTVIEDCLIVENVASSGGGVYVEAGAGALNTWLAGCTVASNYTFGGDGAQLSFRAYSDPDQSLYLERCIFWSTGFCGTSDIDAMEDVPGVGRLNFLCSLNDHSAVSGNMVPRYGPHCLDENPQFCDPRQCDGLPPFGDDYAVTLQSSCRPEVSPCGVLIGAVDELCGASDVPLPVVDGATLSLAAPEPNPTRSTAMFRIGLARAAAVRASIIDVSGREVRVLANHVFEGGAHTIEWNLTDGSSSRVPAGVYSLRVEAAGDVRNARIVVVN